MICFINNFFGSLDQISNIWERQHEKLVEADSKVGNLEVNF